MDKMERLRYIFDLNGYVILRNVLTKQEVAACNTAITQRAEKMQERWSEGVRNTKTDSPLRRSKGRKDLGGVLAWRDVEHDAFRRILVHPELRPLYTMLLGKGYRLDHQPFVISQEKGSEGFHLHGGTVDCESGEYSPHVAYSCVNGQIHNNLLAVSVVLTDHNRGDGGFCVVRGSHKSNFKAPHDMVHGHDLSEFVYQPEMKAGDVLLFSEGTVHGALPWVANHERRVCIYRFAPATMAYGRSYYPEWSAETVAGMSDSMKSVLEPPYAVRLDRPLQQSDNGDVKVQSRSDEKKAFDKKVFQTKYF